MLQFMVALLWLLGAIFSGVLIAAVRREGTALLQGPLQPRFLFTGFVGNFFDTLGIGSFAIETTLFRLGNWLPFGQIPGTLNAGNALPTVAQALIFLTAVPVDLVTLGGMIGAATLGGIVGAYLVPVLPIRLFKWFVGVALLITAGFMLAGKLQWLPAGGVATGLTGGKLLFAVSVNFLLGALMQLGIGLYAPCMALVYSLGLSPLVAFPIMMGSCAFLMLSSGMKLLGTRAQHTGATAGINIGGVAGVLLAAFVVRQLPLDTLRWLVIAVVLYTGLSLLRPSAHKVG